MPNRKETVKSRYSNLSEQVMYEWFIDGKPNSKDHDCKKFHYVFFQSVKDLHPSELTLAEVRRLDRIEEQHNKQQRSKWR